MLSVARRGRALYQLRHLSSFGPRYSIADGQQTSSERFNSIPINLQADPAHQVDITYRQSPGDVIILDDVMQQHVDNKLIKKGRVKSSQYAISLIEALSLNNNLARAETILARSVDNLPHSDFIAARNNILRAYVKEDIEIGDLSKSIKWINHFKANLSEAFIDDEAYAILLAGACSIADDTISKSTIKTINSMMIRDHISVENVFRFRQILDISDIKLVATEVGVSNDALIPFFKGSNSNRDQDIANKQATRNMSSEEIVQRLSRESAKSILEGLPPDVEKPGFESLTPVDSMGIKLLRNALSGIVSAQRPELPIFSEAKASTDGFLGFEEQISKLPKEDQEKYRKAFEDYNRDRQVAIETLVLENAREKWKYDYETLAPLGNAPLKGINSYLWEWHLAFQDALQSEFQRISQLEEKFKQKNVGPAESSEDGVRYRYAPYIKLVDPKKLSVITILEILKLHSSGSVTAGIRTARAVLSVGRAVEREYNSEQLLKRETVGKSELLTETGYRRSLFRATKNKDDLSLGSWRPDWPDDIKAELGSALLSILLDVAQISVSAVEPITKKRIFNNVPALTHQYQYSNGMKIGVLKIHPQFAKKISDEPLTGTLHPQALPMLVKPKPWVSWREGAYHYNRVSLMRTKDSAEQLEYLKEACRRNDLGSVFEALDILGAAAWAINSKVYRVLSTVWNSGEEFLDIPKKFDEKDELPPEPANDADPLERRDWARKCKYLLQLRRVSHSQRCDVNYKLEISRAYLGERMYFPHNIDFRGRAYAIPPHLNHLGNDMCRGLLQFWEAKPVGKRGIQWLKIHLANVCGYDKADFQSRVEYVDTRMDEVFDSADNPLKGRRWWMKASDPWQALAACFEVAEMMRSPNPEEFKSRLPIQQDGTCNGLQHYAALGGDMEGAKQVNLDPSDKPQDIYTYVSDKVAEIVKKDFENGVETAELVNGLISRKIVKQSVMTNVYGVTFIGARAQILSRLKELEKIPERQLWDAASYLTRLVFSVVRNLFNGAHLIQDWLGECAKKIARSMPSDVGNLESPSRSGSSCMNAVVWTSPLGLPVVQPYRAAVRRQVNTNLQTVYISDPYLIHPVNARKQETAFPPNFIHSLDATHMLLSALACGRNGLTFAAVHDSYWTHACDIDRMNAILRDAFIKLHEGDLIQRLKEEFEIRYKNYYTLAKINKQSDVAKQIIAWRSRFKKELGREINMSDEVEVEEKRRKLLESSDPKLRKQGEEMVTPLGILGNEPLENLAPLPRHVSVVKHVKSTENEVYVNSDLIIQNTLRNIEREKKGEKTLSVEEEKESLDGSLQESSAIDEGITEPALEEENEEDQELVANNAQVYKSTGPSITVTIPLTFPEVPSKGKFDVSKLRHSLYFFS
ncbi:hypothetical protein V1514DRAFT_309500 [Lipomyces japonicus]|uniref:uncharacterized protein n=1 Tax=Lipomyces japonicus TaxID=56871 RepID=UPI0034CF12DF